ncbi:MAG: ATP-binding cassette subfamily B protein [Candidatus Poriferisodalaceae bacterium]
MSGSRSPEIRPFRFGWQTGTTRPKLWGVAWILWTVFVMLPLIAGWLLKLAFDALSSNESITGFLVLLGISEAIRWVVFAVAVYVVVRWWVSALTVMRTNMLEAQTVSGGPRSATLPDSPAEAISRFHDDARDAVLWTDSWVDGSGYIIYAVTALGIMSTIDGRAAFVVLIPLVVVTAITRYLTPRLHAARSADRKATGRVTAFLGETFTGMLAFRLAGREDAAIARLETHTAIRRGTAVRDTVIQQAIDGMASSTSDITVGLTLLVLVPAVRSGDFSVGDLALFVTYAVQLGELPRYVARIITSREQAIVSYERMGEMVADGDAAGVVEHRLVTIEPNETKLGRDPDPARVRLEQLEIRGLTAQYPSNGGGVEDINLTFERGTFNVVTGPVGAGKSTLLRAIIGLIDHDQGSIVWNGSEIVDAAAWFVPPNAAHLPQVPSLFSESLADNISLGRDTETLDDILELTTLASDLDEMPDGLDTMVGARGLRLSGGQAQRVATARSLLTQPELLVVDDLSSALDVATEKELWDRLSDLGSTTVIAISQRQLAIDRADQVITMADGRVASVKVRRPLV